MQTLETCGECYYFFPNRTWQEESAHPHSAYIYPPVKSKFAASSILSYSMFDNMSVLITTDGTGYLIGYNIFNIKIGSEIPHTLFDYTKLDIRSPSNQPLKLVSACCCKFVAVFILTNGDQNYLAVQEVGSKTTQPLFLDTSGLKPISLYNGYSSFGVIDSEGGFFIGDPCILNKPFNTILKHFNLPNNEKASMICVVQRVTFVLSSTGHLYTLQYSSGVASEVPELKNIEIDWLSGLYHFCYVVTKDHKVFIYGDIGLACCEITNISVNNGSKFVHLDILDGLGIDRAFAGINHSFFKNADGKLYGMGFNSHGYLLLASGPSKDRYSKPVETIVNDASFLVLDHFATALFRNYIPPQSPNNKTTFDTKVSPAPIPSKFGSNISMLKEKIRKLQKQINNERKEKNSIITENKKLKKQLISLQDEFDEKMLDIDVDFQNKLMKADKEFKEKLDNKDKELSEKIAIEKEKHEIEVKKIKQEINDKNKKNTKNIEILDLEAINNLERLEKIGSGSNGNVYKVSKKMFYALKTMNICAKKIDFKQFLKEQELICSLDHPNVVKTYGIYLSDESRPPSLLLEYCQTNLDKSIKNKTLSNVDIVFVIFQIVEVMKFVHSKNILHRDLKPTNILLNNNSIVKISDFGKSKLMTVEDQFLAGGIGTQRFMAPELLNEEDYNEKIDIYSFGVVIFFILSGGEFPNISVLKVGNGEKAKIPSTFKEESRKLIDMCWNFDPKERPSFEEISNFLSENNFNLINLSKTEIKEIKSKIKEHLEKIPYF